MIVYKFRINFEDPEDVTRDIEIKPAQTFEIFHKAIQDSINFDASGEAEFFTSDDYWRKGEKISFKELGTKKLSQFIEDPHQKFIYEYASKSNWTLFIELFKIVDGEDENTYPRCVKSVGDAPSQYHLINPAVVPGETNEENGIDEVVDDSMFYRDADDMLTTDSQRQAMIDESDYEAEEGDEFQDEDSFGEENFEEDEF